jgi:hypothetical protein
MPMNKGGILMGFFRACALGLLFAATACATPAAAQQPRVTIQFDPSLADRSLSLACSGRAVDEAAIRNSPVVQAQIRHNSALKATATMDAYVAAMRALSACQAPTDDPFNVAQILADRDGFRAKIAALAEHRTELSARVAQMLAPYMPPGPAYHGNVVLAVPYFSCGGFSFEQYFFIDIACMNAGLEGDMDSVRLLIAHETFHAIQAQRYFHVIDEPDEVHDRATALEFMFGSLLWEGMAEHVAPTAELANTTGGGRLTQIFRKFQQDNVNRVRSNFAATSVMFEYVADTTDADAQRRATAAYSVPFSGTFTQFGYYVGDRMAKDIEDAWGRDALVCVTQLPPEQFVLAHDAVTQNVPEARRLSAPVVAAAQWLASTRHGTGTFERCRAH